MEFTFRECPDVENEAEFVLQTRRCVRIAQHCIDLTLAVEDLALPADRLSVVADGLAAAGSDNQNCQKEPPEWAIRPVGKTGSLREVARMERNDGAGRARIQSC